MSVRSIHSTGYDTTAVMTPRAPTGSAPTGSAPAPHATLSSPPHAGDERIAPGPTGAETHASKKQWKDEPSPRTFRSEETALRCVLDTRPVTSPSFAARLGDAGIDVLHIPMIRIEGVALNEDIATALRMLPTFDGVLLTSMNAVRFFAILLRDAGIEAERLPQVFVVGPRTAEEARNAGFAHQPLPSSSYGATLAAELPDVRDRRFLQPCSDIAREEVAEGIRARGGEIQQLVVYRTLPPDDENARRLAEHTDLQTYDCVAFFSPSAVRHYAELLPETQRHTAIVAVIGDTTGAEAATHDLRVRIIPREQHAAALADAIVAWHQGRYSDDTAA